MSPIPHSGQAEQPIYEGTVIVSFDTPHVDTDGFLDEFTDANETAVRDGPPRPVFTITYQLVAPTKPEAYRRLINLVEAKAAIGGWHRHLTIDDSDITLIS